MTTSGLSVQLYTVRDAISADLPGTLERLAGLGFRQVELYGFVDRAAEYAELLPRFGLTAPTAHVNLVGRELAPVLDAAATLGIERVIDPVADPARWTTREDVAALASQLNEVATIAADRGIEVGYHNHWWELENRIDGTPALEVFASLLEPSVALEVDTYWAIVGGVPAVGLLERLGDRVAAIHVKDGPLTSETTVETIGDNKKNQVAVGHGAVPVLDILAAAPHALKVVELDDFDGDVFDALADSIAYLTANGFGA